MSIWEEKLTKSGVRRDWIDLRDQSYRPNLTVLPNERSLDPRLMVRLGSVPKNYLRQMPAMPGDTVLEKPPSLIWRRPFFDVRHQGSSGRCVGYALANLVDIQRSLQRLDVSEDLVGTKDDVVSADMLYRMAFFHDRYPDPSENSESIVDGVRTLRAAIKGFYHHGACRDWLDLTKEPEQGTWQSEGINPNSTHKTQLFPSVAQTKKAREIILGAYYRLSSVLNHFHAALKDAGAILSSAKVHDGWLRATPQTGGIIAWPPKVGTQSAHAFVITGYDRHGFHVLNSWGDGWGGYMGQVGIGLWPYADWAQNVIDAWVLRMGVYAPRAFGASIGEHGTRRVTGTVRAGSMPCLDLVGHYMHLDDGFHVSIGSYPSFPDDWEKTCEYLENELTRPAEEDQELAPTTGTTTARYRGVLVWIPGSLEGIKPAFAAAVKRKNRIKALGLYPYSILWCNDFVEKSLDVLHSIFANCQAQAGENAEHLDNLIEQRAQGVGRAFWRDIELAARRSVRGTTELPFELDEDDLAGRIEKGHVGVLLSGIMALKKTTGCEVHIVAEGAGALVFHEMLTILEDDFDRKAEHRQFCAHDAAYVFNSIHLVHAAIGMPRAEKLIVPLFSRMNGKDSGSSRSKFSNLAKVEKLKPYPAKPRARVYIPTRELEDRVSFGSYGNSILHLISHAFEDREPAPASSRNENLRIFREPRPLLGMASTADYRKAELKGAVYCLNRLATQINGWSPVSQSQLDEDPTINEHIFDAIERLRET